MDSAVLLTFDSLRDVVDPIRRTFHLGGPSGISLAEAIPPHMTLASPAHPDPTGDEAGALLQQSVHGIGRFDVRFATVRTFPQGTVYLAPDDSQGLDLLKARVQAAFLPFGGVLPNHIWHLTVARSGGRALADRVQATVESITATVGDVSLWTREGPYDPWTCCRRVSLE